MIYIGNVLALSQNIGGSMRYFQIAIFFLATLFFLSAIYFIKSAMGEILWRAGMATLLFDIVCIMLWPNKPEKN